MGPVAPLTPLPEQVLHDAAAWDALQAAQRPVVLRGLVPDWPLVRCARVSPEAVCAALMRYDNGQPVDAVMVPPESGGRIGYGGGASGFNYLRNRVPVSAVLEQIARYSRFDVAPAVAVQSAVIDECLPGFAQAHPVPWVAPGTVARIWIGNGVVTPAHVDESSNLACVAAGRRRFTLFPPDAAANLYLGPVDHTPTGSPISLIDTRNPDLARHPRYRKALEVAAFAELAPGDAIYIPPLWWHQVESLEALNVLVNCWWRRPGALAGGSPFDALLHALLALKGAGAAERAAWRALFDHLVFHEGADPAAHLPAEWQGVLGQPSPALEQDIRDWLVRRLGQKEAT
ncbi:MAG: cupin-like domain-containing protein [Betaproteobacteria bacterium]|nr:cupin-like domain-containing protein [Betaproteobacteria bacterium]